MTALSFRLIAPLALALLGWPWSGCASFVRGAPAHAGIKNFGRVNSRLFRGAEPTAAGLVSLQRLGVRTIIDLTPPTDHRATPAAFARAPGILFRSVPLPPLGAPTDAEVTAVLALIESSPPPVFVHCEHGADRTGTIIACYRMQHDGWTEARAFAEAKSYGFSIFQIGMRHYIRHFPSHLRA